MNQVKLSSLTKEVQKEIRSILKGNGIDGRACKLWNDGGKVVIEIVKIGKFIRLDEVMTKKAETQAQEAAEYKEQLTAALVAPLAPSCTVCGNEKAEELEQVKVYPGDGIEEELTICQEDKGCNAPQISEPLSHQVVTERIQVDSSKISGEFHIDGADGYLIAFKDCFRVEGYRGEESYKQEFTYAHEAFHEFYRLQIRMMNGEVL